MLDLVNKKIMLYDNHLKDSFVETINDIDKIKIKNIENGKTIKIKTKDNNDIEIELDKLNRITKYTNNKITKLNNYCLYENYTLLELNIPNVEFIGMRCCRKTKDLKILNAPKVKEICCESFIYNSIEEIDLNNLYRIENWCFQNGKTISKFNVPKLKEIYFSCFTNVKITCDINLPNLEYMGDDCFERCVELKNIYLPKLKKMGNDCFYNNKSVISIYAPKLQYMGNYCFYCNKTIEKIELFRSKKMEYNFYNNTSVKEFNIPLDVISDYCFLYNEYIQELINKNKKNKLIKSKVLRKEK